MTPADTFRDPVSFPAYMIKGGYLCVPRFYGADHFGPPQIDETQEGEAFDEAVRFEGALKPHQIEATGKILAACGCEAEDGADGGVGVVGAAERMPARPPSLAGAMGGMLCIGCGMGKTVCGIYVSMRLRRRTLVLVHKGFLMSQWAERIRQFTNASIGFIRQDCAETDRDVVIGMIQSISKRDYDLSTFGLLIIDEAHHVAAPLFKEAVFKVRAKRVLALSATPNRKDGLSRLLHHSMGPVLFSAERPAETVRIVSLYVPIGKRREMVGRDGRPIYSKMLNALCGDEERTLLVSERMKGLLGDGRRIIVLSDRISQLEQLLACLTGRQGVLAADCGYYIGRSTEAERAEAETKKIMLSSYSMAREGLDCPHLDTLVLLSPIGDVTQAVGRILRHHPDKQTPLVLDVMDEYSVFQHMSRKRKNYYSKQGYVIETESSS